MIQLYPFQETLIQQTRAAIRRGVKRILLVSPTGSGKTVMFAYLVSRMSANRVRSNVMAHRQELLAQIGGTLDKFDTEHGYIASAAEFDPKPLSHVSSVFTLAKRLDKSPQPKYGICDEAHHCIDGSTWANCLKYWAANDPNFIAIGVTATPERLDGAGLASMWDEMIVGPSTGDLIRDGYLSKYKIFAPPVAVDMTGVRRLGGDYKRNESEAAVNKPTITGNAVAHYRKYLNGAPTLGFAVSVKHAHDCAEQFKSAGFRAACIDGKMKDKDRKQMTDDFGAGRLNLLFSCDLISEGYDVPGAMGCINLRPTESLALCLQQWGRVLRKAPGKEFAYILDHVGNSARHGLPCSDREWSLTSEKRSKRKRDEDDIAIRQCGDCGAVVGAAATSCPECGHVFPIKPRNIKEVEGELEEVRRQEQLQFKRNQGQAKDFDALVQLGKMRGMKQPYAWANHVLNARNRKANAR